MNRTPEERMIRLGRTLERVTEIRTLSESARKTIGTLRHEVGWAIDQGMISKTKTGYLLGDLNTSLATMSNLSRAMDRLVGEILAQLAAPESAANEMLDALQGLFNETNRPASGHDARNWKKAHEAIMKATARKPDDLTPGESNAQD